MKGLNAVKIAECQLLTSWFLLFSWVWSRICSLCCWGQPGYATKKASTARPSSKQHTKQLASARWSSQNLALSWVFHRKVRELWSNFFWVSSTLKTWQDMGIRGIFFLIAAAPVKAAAHDKSKKCEPFLLSWYGRTDICLM